jgi:uncharacterized membrane protein
VFSILDWIALAFFVVSWLGYHWAVELTPAARKGLNGLMNAQRRAWMEQMRVRELRIVDTTIMASLQNGTAFFASTSLIAIGGALALMRSADDAVAILSDTPFGISTSRLAWELKVAGLAVIFVYAFFKFAWSYRLFNYAAVLLGAVPMPGKGSEEESRAAASRTAEMCVVAGKHFNSGQRAFFFALAYLGWFVGSAVFMATTAGVILVMWRRQFASTARDAVLDRLHGDVT